MQPRRPRLSRHDEPSNGAFYLLAVVILVGGAAVGYLAQMSKRTVATGTDLPVSGFDINYMPTSGAPASAPPPSAPAGAGASPAPTTPAFARRPASSPASRPAATTAAAPASRDPEVASSRNWLSMLAGPATFLATRTNLRSAAGLQAFLADKKRVEYYAGHPLVRQVTASPALVALLLRPSMARAFIATPAMRDDRAVAALARSPLIGQLLRSPGVQQALNDPARVNALIADPEILRWMGEHPVVVHALSQAHPGLAGLSALGAVPK